MSLAFREAREADLDRLVDLHLSAFPDARGIDARRRNFAHNPRGALHDLVVAEQGGSLVAHGFLFALEAWFGGSRVQVGGIASLGVSPEARGTGVARALLAELHARSHRRGDAVTLLYAFREGFYATNGYASVSPYRVLRFSPRAIPGAWSSHPGIVRPATGDDREALERVHEHEAARRTGWTARSSALWDKKLLDERRRWFVVETEEAGVVGFVAWTLSQTEPHAPVSLVVEDLAAEDDRARARLLALVGAQRDQVASVSLDVSEDDPLPRALVDADRDEVGTERVEHPLGALVAGPMVRIADLQRAIEARGYLADGGLDIVLPDARVHVEVTAGRARVLAPRGGPQITLAPGVMAAILYGSLAPTTGARLGWISADTPAALRQADALFTLPAFFGQDPF